MEIFKNCKMTIPKGKQEIYIKDFKI